MVVRESERVLILYENNVWVERGGSWSNTTSVKVLKVSERIQTGARERQHTKRIRQHTKRI